MSDAPPARDGATRRLEIPADALIVLLAPSGAGKSTFASRHFLETEIVSSDRCRALVSDDEANQEATRAAFTVFNAIVRGRLRLGRLCVADATNLEPYPRLRLREQANEFGRPVVAVVLAVGPETAQRQNLQRARVVPDHVVERHYRRFAIAREAVRTEEYDAVHEIDPAEPLEIVRVQRQVD